MVFKKGHKTNVGKVCTDITKNRIRDALIERRDRLGYVNSLEVRKKISEAGIGRTAWNKGLKFPNLSGEKSSSWNGGKIKHSCGYILIHNPEHPFCTSSNYVFEHRLVMEKKLGRYLKPEEVVHHLDRQHKNNSRDNLHVFKNNSEHIKYHRFLRDCVRSLCGE